MCLSVCVRVYACVCVRVCVYVCVRGHCDVPEHLARVFVKMNGLRPNNTPTIIERFIEEHKRGSASVHNVPGLLFYLISGHQKQWTCDDLLTAVEKVCNSRSVVERLIR